MMNTITEAIEDIRKGKIILVVDDEDRENEGDMICASELITPELVNFMSKEAKGLMCVALTKERCQELGLELMVKGNSSPYQTAFTVSVDLMGHGCSTGISAFDRSQTIKALVNPEIRPSEFGIPGHIFPLIGAKGGVRERPGHTEAAIELAQLAGLKPSGVLIEVLNRDGSMARLPDLEKMAVAFDMKLISIADLIAYLEGK